jgi:hypothetical protein
MRYLKRPAVSMFPTAAPRRPSCTTCVFAPATASSVPPPEKKWYTEPVGAPAAEVMSFSEVPLNPRCRNDSAVAATIRSRCELISESRTIDPLE